MEKNIKKTRKLIQTELVRNQARILLFHIFLNISAKLKQHGPKSARLRYPEHSLFQNRKADITDALHIRIGTFHALLFRAKIHHCTHMILAEQRFLVSLRNMVQVSASEQPSRKKIPPVGSHDSAQIPGVVKALQRKALSCENPTAISGFRALRI